MTGILAAIAGSGAKAPFQIAGTPVVQTATATSIAINTPATTGVSDLLIALAFNASGNSWTPDAAFTERLDSNSLELSTFLVAGSPSSTYTFSTLSAQIAATMIRATSATYDTVGTVTTPSTTSPAAPSISLSASGILLAVFFNPNSSVSFSTPTGMSPLVSSNSNNASFAVFRESVSSGATGTRTSTASGSAGNNQSRGVLLGIIPS